MIVEPINFFGMTEAEMLEGVKEIQQVHHYGKWICMQTDVGCQKGLLRVSCFSNLLSIFFLVHFGSDFPVVDLVPLEAKPQEDLSSRLLQ